MGRTVVWAFAVGLSLCPAAARADDAPPGPNRKDEPVARTFSLAKAAGFLDAAAVAWQKERQCFTCHTNLAYLYARPAAADSTVPATVRRELEALVTERWPARGPRWDTEVVAAAAALAYHDAATTGALHPTTKAALDRMWAVQQPDGGWKWLKCDWPPMENDDHYGATLAAVAVGVAPGQYADTPAARRGLAGLTRYFAANPPQNAHHKAMLLWAASYRGELLPAAARDAYVKELRALQRPDGGWASAGLGAWPRGDRTAQEPTVSDGYGTGFVLFVLRRAGVPADDPAATAGAAWLRANQRASGRWFTRSLRRDGRHYLTHAGTAFAVMALAACDEPAAR